MILIIKDIWKILDNKRKFQFSFLFLLMLIAAFLEALTIGLILPILIFLTQDLGNTNLYFLNFIKDFFLKFDSYNLVIFSIVLFCLVYSAKIVFLLFFNWIQNSYIFGWKVDLSQTVFKKYMSLPYDFHLNNNSSVLFRNSSSEVDKCIGVVNNFLYLILELLITTGILILLVLIDLNITLLIFGVLGLVGVIFHFTTKNKIKSLGLVRLKTERFKIQYLKQGLNGIKDVKIYGKANEFLKQYYVVNQKNQKAYQVFLIFQKIPRLILELSAVILLAILTLYLNKQEFLLASPIPILGVFVVSALRLMPSINKITTIYQAVIFDKPALVVISNIFDLKSFSQAHKFKNICNELKFENQIDVKNISFKYANNSLEILKNISFQIRKGEYIGLVGKSGSGKSTLADIILGLLFPSEGEVLLDQKNINENYRSWQNKIGYVPQTIYFTDDTLKKNIAFGIPTDQIDEKKLNIAIENAQLTSLVRQLPDGVETLMGEFGHNLSGGERQRIGIARAFYNNAQILFFDEATNSLDFETEKRIFEIIKNFKRKKTIIVITHKEEMLSGIDKIIRVSGGKIKSTI